MKNLRRLIRNILLEDKTSFMKELIGNPTWDEGTRDVENAYNADRFVRARNRGRTVKQIWSKHVDREFIDSLVYIHWNNYHNLRSAAIEIATNPNTNKDELACGAYIQGEVPYAGDIGNIGFLLDGYVTLVANDMHKVYSGSRIDTQFANPEMKNTSGINRGVQVANAQTYVLDRRSFQYRRKAGKEAFVDNWRISAIVCNARYDVDFEKAKKIQKLLERGGIDVPLVDPLEL